MTAVTAEKPGTAGTAEKPGTVGTAEEPETAEKPETAGTAEPAVKPEIPESGTGAEPTQGKIQEIPGAPRTDRLRKRTRMFKADSQPHLKIRIR